jgi:hypothetical protein
MNSSILPRATVVATRKWWPGDFPRSGKRPEQAGAALPICLSSDPTLPTKSRGSARLQGLALTLAPAAVWLSAGVGCRAFITSRN